MAVPPDSPAGPRVARRAHAALLTVYRWLPKAARRRVVRALYPTFTVGAIAVIERDDGHVLLVRHSYRRRWGFPGGILNRGEQPGTAAVRETAEEVGLEVELVGPPTVVVEADVRRVDVVHRCRPVPGAAPGGVEPRSPEIVETRWFPLDALPELQAEGAAALRALAAAERRGR